MYTLIIGPTPLSASLANAKSVSQKLPCFPFTVGLLAVISRSLKWTCYERSSDGLPPGWVHIIVLALGVAWKMSAPSLQHLCVVDRQRLDGVRG